MELKKNIYLDQILKERFKEGFDLIQVILGPRQVGKTTSILKLLSEYKGVSHYVSAEGQLVTNLEWINQVWQEAQDKSPEALLVIDEIQKIPNWSERIKTLWDLQKRSSSQSTLKLILLGSSSLTIQKGLSESLTGRFELIKAYHWSLEESQEFIKMNLEEYLKYGGYPGSYKIINNKKRFQDYIQSAIIETVIEKDLLTQGRVRNPALFRQTFYLLQKLPASEVSYTKLLGQLQDKGNTDLVKNYIELFEGAFLFKQIYKYQSNLKSRLSSPKIICIAPALLDFASKEDPIFLGRCFESLVGADLIRSDFSVSYWRDLDHEIDFVIPWKTGVVGIEVKSGKRKSSKSASEFKKQFPKSHLIYINYENYKKFALSPKDFISKHIEG